MRLTLDLFGHRLDITLDQLIDVEGEDDYTALGSNVELADPYPATVGFRHQRSQEPQ